MLPRVGLYTDNFDRRSRSFSPVRPNNKPPDSSVLPRSQNRPSLPVSVDRLMLRAQHVNLKKSVGQLPPSIQYVNLEKKEGFSNVKDRLLFLRHATFMADPTHKDTIAMRSEEIFSKAIQLKAKKIVFVSGNVERQINTVEALSKLIELNNDDIQLVNYIDTACNDLELGNVLNDEYQEYLRGNPTNYDPFFKGASDGKVADETIKMFATRVESFLNKLLDQLSGDTNMLLVVVTSRSNLCVITGLLGDGFSSQNFCQKSILFEPLHLFVP